ncbi:MAG: sulfite exporter TauE/SafE family protein, partial [Burkholderiaceae bacterium]
MSMPDGMWPLTLLIFVFAGSIKGLVGVGMPTAAVSIFAQIADPRLAIALLIIPSLALNIWQIIRSGQLSATVR